MIMKTIKNLTVKVTFEVDYKNIEISDKGNNLSCKVQDIELVNLGDSEDDEILEMEE